MAKKTPERTVSEVRERVADVSDEVQGKVREMSEEVRRGAERASEEIRRGYERASKAAREGYEMATSHAAREAPIMRQIDPLFGDEQAQEVFNAVARERRITLRKLTEELGLGKHELQEKLYTLKRAELVNEKLSSIDDLNVYYLTSDGFSADRKLRRLGVKLRALP